MTTLTLGRSYPLLHTVRQAVSMRTAIVLAGFAALLSSGLAAVHLNAMHCAAGQHTLMYPVYDRKGIIIDYTHLCGEVHRGCVLREGGTGTEYECSPFMAPDSIKSAFSIQN